MNVASWIDSVWQIGWLYAVQSTILILSVMAIIRVCRVRDAAVLSMVYRFTLVAVVASPWVTVAMKQGNVDGWWPAKQVVESTEPIAVQTIVQGDNDATRRVNVNSFAEQALVPATVDSLALGDVPPSKPIRQETAEDATKEARKEATSVAMTPPTRDAATPGDVRAILVGKLIAVATWLIVSMVLLIRHGLAFVSLNRVLKHSAPADTAIQDLCDRMAGELEIQSPRVVYSPFFESPFLSGVWNPVIHLCSDDDAVMAAGPETEIRDVLAHELAHLKRHDLTARMMSHAALSLLFFQPLLWWLVDQIESTAEDVCDDFALELGATRQRYARRLIDLAERCDFPLGSAVGIASGNSMLQHRVTRIMEDGRRLSMRTGMKAKLSAAAVSIAAVLIAGLLFTPAVPATAGPIADITNSVETETDTPTSNKTKPITITGRVVDSQSNGVANARVSVRYRKMSAQFRQTLNSVEAIATTDALGGFSVDIISQTKSFQTWEIVASANDDREVGFFRYEMSDKPFVNSPIEIQVEPTQPRVVTVVDAEGRPVADAKVGVRLGLVHTLVGMSTDKNGRVEVLLPESERIEVVIAWKDGVGFDYKAYRLDVNQRSDLITPVPEFPESGETLRLDGASPVTVKVVDSSGSPVEGVHLSPWLFQKDTANDRLNVGYFFQTVGQLTDAAGQTTFAWMPTWQKSLVTLWPSAEGYFRSRASYEPTIDQGAMTITLEPLVSIRGKVFDEQGNPAGGMLVKATGRGYGPDEGGDQALSADDGTYKLQVPPEQVYMVTVEDDQWVSDAVTSFVVNVGKPVDGIDLKLRRPTILTGQLTADGSGDPIQGEPVIIYHYGDDLKTIEGEIANPENSRLRHVRPTLIKGAWTDSEGRFEFRLGNGSYDIRPPTQRKAEEFKVSGTKPMTIDVTTEIQTKSKLTGFVREHKTERPLAGVRLSSVAQRFPGRWLAVTDDNGAFAVERRSEKTYVYAMNADRTLGAVAALSAEQETLNMYLMQTGSAHGVLLQADSEVPAAETKIQFLIREPDDRIQTWGNQFGGSVVTDDQGRFELDGLIPGWEYRLMLESRPDGIIPGLGGVTVIEPGQRVDLGTLNVPVPRKR